MIDRIAHLLRAEMALRAVDELRATGSRELSEAVIDKVVAVTASDLTEALATWASPPPPESPPPAAAESGEAPLSPQRSETISMALSAAQLDLIVRGAVRATLAEGKLGGDSEPLGSESCCTEPVGVPVIEAPSAPLRRTRG